MGPDNATPGVTPMKMNRIVPMLPVSSIAGSVAFYGKLGFQVEQRNDSWGWAMLISGETRIMLDRSINTAPSAPRQSVLYLYPEDIEAFHQQVRSAGLDIPDLETTFYGMTEFRLQDPDGNPLWIGQNKAGSSQASQLITSLNLKPHPEGGHYAEVFRSSQRVQTPRGERSALTTIDFLLRHGEFSAWHRVLSDEVWHLLGGGPLHLHVLMPDTDRIETMELGPGLRRYVVPAGAWQAAEPAGEFAYVGASVGPGFEFADFCLGRDDPQLRGRLEQIEPRLLGLL